MAEFFHIYIERLPNVTREQVEEKMNLAVDWYRYHNQVCLVKTTSGVEKWKARLKPFVQPGGSLFICKLDPSNYSGWMTSSFWEWFKKARDD